MGRCWQWRNECTDADAGKMESGWMHGAWWFVGGTDGWVGISVEERRDAGRMGLPQIGSSVGFVYS